jgi:hypothetical protein
MPPELTTAIAIAALIVALLTLSLLLVLSLRGRRRRRALSGADLGTGDLGPAVEKALWRLDELTKRVDGLQGRMPVVEDQGRRAVQRVGVVRFNPFEDTGGNQSFALALLDSKSDGIVISSLHSRQQTRLYLKSVVAGKCETALSDEEAEALRRAGVGQPSS